MTATVDAVLTTVQGDGGGDGKSITTPGTMTGKRLLVAVGSSTNSDTIGAPASGTWVEVALPDNVITTSGGQLRVFQGRSLAASTAYAFTLTGGRRTVVGLVISGHDDSGASMVDQASSLESAAGSTHAPPSVTPTASAELCVDFLMFRHFFPDTSTGSPPSTGLTWTEHADVRGADSNNNVQINAASATAGSSGVAISTAAWNTDDPFEPAMVARIVILSAAGGGSSAAPTSLAIPVTFGAPAAALVSAAPAGLSVPLAFGSPTTTRQSSAPTGLSIPVMLGAPAVGIPAAAPSSLAVPVTFGLPRVSAGAFPAGLAVPLSFGNPTVTRPSAAPSSLAIPVTLGAPAGALGRTAAPSSLAVPVTLGAPQAGAQAPYATATLAAGAGSAAALAPGAAAAAATLTASAISPATLTAGSA